VPAPVVGGQQSKVRYQRQPTDLVFVSRITHRRLIALFLALASMCYSIRSANAVCTLIVSDMNSVSPRRSRISLIAMIVGGLLAIAPVFGPLGKTWRYLSDFFAERPKSMRGPDNSFYVELLALIKCPGGLLLFAISLVLFIRSGKRTAPGA
jgi:hypothetical protein